MYKLLLVGACGLAGTLARYWISQWIDERAAAGLPWGTIAVNLLGCFAAGFLFHVLGTPQVSAELRLAVFTGFLGGFTTFSAFALQTLTLARNGGSQAAVLNVLVSLAGCLAMVWTGARTAGLFTGQ